MNNNSSIVENSIHRKVYAAGLTELQGVAFFNPKSRPYFVVAARLAETQQREILDCLSLSLAAMPWPLKLGAFELHLYNDGTMGLGTPQWQVQNG